MDRATYLLWQQARTVEMLRRLDRGDRIEDVARDFNIAVATLRLRVLAHLGGAPKRPPALKKPKRLSRRTA